MIALAVRVLRIAAKVVLVAVAVVALLVGVTWTFLQTRRGSELVRRIALPRVNAAIAGQITLGRFAFGGDRLTLENLAIYDPDSRLVARIAGIDVGFSPLALLRRHVEVRVLAIRRPELALVQDDSGLNLARALARRPPPGGGRGTGAAPAGDGGRPTIDVRSLTVTAGVIDYVSTAGETDRHVHIADLSIRGSASLASDHVVADAALSARGGRLDARGSFDFAARRGHATVRASSRGIALAADGNIYGDDLIARAQIDAADLAATSRALARDFGLPPVALAGNGRLDVVLGGTKARPSLRLAARFPALGFGGSRARDLIAAAWLPDLGAPDAVDAEASASTVSFGGQSLRAAEIAVHAVGRDVTAHAAIAAPQPLRVDLAGKRERAGARALTIDVLRVRYPETTWSLRRRARLSFGDAVVLSGFELGAGAQRLAAALRVGGGSDSAHVVVSRIDLGRLPRALLPPGLGLGGVVDADLRADLGAAPRVVATAALTAGRIRGHRDLSFDLAARLDRGRARGELRARALGTRAVASFDLPAAWPPRDPRAPLALAVDIADADLAGVAAAIQTARDGAPRVKGHARVSLRLDGRIGRPRLQLLVAGRGLVFDDRQIGDLELSVSGEGNGALAARLTSIAPVRTRIDVTTPLSLRAILAHPPGAATLARTPFEIVGNLDRLPLSVLARAAGHPDRFGGWLSANLSIRGTASEPEGTIAVDVAGAATGRFPPTDARIELDFGGRAVEARARVVRKARPLLAAETRVELPLGDLFRPARLAAAPVRVRAVFGPYVLQRVGLPPLSDREPPRELKGRVHADLSVDGTFGAPRVVVHVQGSDFRLDKGLIGFAQLEATYADRRARLDARLTSPNGGTLRAIASLTADLGYPAVTRGFDVRRAPLDVRVDAQRFDVQGLSGLTQQLRTVAGAVTTSATIRGTLVDPRVAGRIEWTDGVVAVTGFGEYKAIHLLIHGDENQLVLDELAAKSGSGSARVTGRAKRPGGRGYELSADAKLERFPIYTQGQALAVVSLASRVSGRAAPLDTRLSVDIDDAKIELPETKRRDLQALAAPADVVLVDRNRPLNRAQAAKLQALLEGGQARARAPVRSPSLRVRINSPRHLWVSGKDARLELGLSPDFHISMGDRTQIFGQVTVHRGRVDVLGRRFDIKADSTLTFGGAADQPELDVRAEHINQPQNVTVLITIKGPIDKLAISVTAPNRPDLSESQLYTLIITGQLHLGGGTASGSPSSQAAASLVGGFLASKLQSTLAHRLPLDVLTIDVGGEGVRGTKLEAGRYLTDRLYVGYVGRVGADPTRYQNRNAVHLEYQITSRWEIEAEYGDLGTGTADLMWKKNY